MRTWVLPVALAVAACGDNSSAAIDAATAIPDGSATDASEPIATAEVIRTGLTYPMVAAVDDRLYGSESLGPGAFRLFALGTDGASFTSLSESDTAAGPMQVTDTHLYWLWPGRHSLDFMDGAIYRFERASQEVTPILEGLILPTELGYYGGSFFITEHDGGRLLKVSIDGAIEATLEEEGVSCADVDDRWVVWGSPASSLRMRSHDASTSRELPIPLVPAKLVIAGDEVYLFSFHGDLYLLDTVSGQVTELAEGWPANQGGSVAVVADDDHLYWTNHVAGAIFRLSFADHVIDTFARVEEYPGSLVLDTQYLYWAEPYADRILRAPATSH